jgi:hypothetical protein
MNTLNMPGFTAEDSLYITARHYYQKQQLNSTLLVQGNVVPQMKKHFATYCSECSFWGKLTLRTKWCGELYFDTETGIFDMTDPIPLMCHF